MSKKNEVGDEHAYVKIDKVAHETCVAVSKDEGELVAKKEKVKEEKPLIKTVNNNCYECVRMDVEPATGRFICKRLGHVVTEKNHAGCLYILKKNK